MDQSPRASDAPALHRVLHRFFFALKPAPVEANRIHAFAERTATGARLVQRAHQHITLAITDDFQSLPTMLVDAMLRAGKMARAAPFTLTLNRLSLSNRSLALRPDGAVPPLATLQRTIAAAMAREGVPMRAGWRFSPHQTLAYRNGAPGGRAIDGFGWHVEDFVLIHSHVGRTRHEELGRWRLTGGDQLALF
ncbi:2'-5' RNA ligase family protein [Sphingobium aquiterrae]|uniref:2'-5' RNA ligase family protein n=1 Tax=Sphingobium aquiterrae TaxID=2038656 RepID=UPI0030194EEC